MAQKGGRPLPGFAELEEIRKEAETEVVRFCERLGILRSTWYYWRAGHVRGEEVARWPAPVVDEIEAVVSDVAEKYPAWGHRKV